LVLWNGKELGRAMKRVIRRERKGRVRISEFGRRNESELLFALNNFIKVDNGCCFWSFGYIGLGKPNISCR
jgi:hypothetical protein